MQKVFQPERRSSSMTSFLLSNQPGFEEEKQKSFRQAADYGPDAFFANCDIGASPEEKALRSLLATRFRERFSDVVMIVPPLSHLFAHMAPMLCALRPTQFIILPEASKTTLLRESRLANQTDNRDRSVFFLTKEPPQDQVVPDAVVRQFRAFGLLGSREAIGTWTPPLARSEDDRSSSLEQGVDPRSGVAGDKQTSGSGQGVGSSSLPYVAKSELLQGEERNGGPHRADDDTTQSSRDSSPSPRPLHHYSFVEKLSTSVPTGRPDADDGDRDDPAHLPSRPPRSRRRPFVEIAEDPEAFFQWISANFSSEASSAPNRISSRARLPLVLHLGILRHGLVQRCAPPRGFCFAIGHGVDEDAVWRTNEDTAEDVLTNWKKRIFWPPRDFADAIFRVEPQQYELGDGLRPQAGTVVPPTGGEKSLLVAERPVRLLFASTGSDPWGAEVVKQFTDLARSGAFEVGVSPHPAT